MITPNVRNRGEQEDPMSYYVSDAIVVGRLEPTVLVSIQPDGVGRTTSIYLLANATVERVLSTE